MRLGGRDCNFMRLLIRQFYKIFLGRIIFFIKEDVKAGIRYKQGRIETNSGTIHQSLSITESVDYINNVFADYLQYSGKNRFSGRAAEVGPGDNSGVALLFRDAGCDQVDLLDRFYSRRDSAHESDIYAHLASQHNNIKYFIQVGEDGKNVLSGVNRYYGNSASAENFFHSRLGQYDVIFSRAVLEHVQDVDAAIGSMSDGLRKDGIMIHKIDLRDHGMFSDRWHELKWLAVPSLLWKWLSRHSGSPNRTLFPEYLQIADKYGLDATFLVTRLAGVGDIVPHLTWDKIPQDQRKQAISFVRSVRSHFCAQFRGFSDKDLAITGLFMIARKI